MCDDSLDEFRQAPREWGLEQELEIAAEVYGPEPKGLRTPPSERCPGLRSVPDTHPATSEPPHAHDMPSPQPDGLPDATT